MSWPMGVRFRSKIDEIILKKLFVAFLFIFALITQAAELPRGTDSSQTVVREYLKIHKQFITELCPQGTEKKFDLLTEDFRKLGMYVPVLPNGNLDISAIQKNLGHLKRQRIWILSLIDELNTKEGEFQKFKSEVVWLNQFLQTLMQDKKDFFTDGVKFQKEILKARALFNMKGFKLAFFGFVKKTTFLQSFDYPSPIAELRASYDFFKASKNFSKANEIYFYRKIIEDGTNDKENRLQDTNARLTLNTVFFKLQKQNYFLSEDLYFDLKYLFSAWDRLLDEGKEKQTERLKRWQTRLDLRYGFYEKLLKNPNEAKRIIEEENSARNHLEKFVSEKEKETYLFWAKQSELMQALFSIETILYNEVGSLDKDKLDRSDIVQIILNRSEMPYYWILAPEDHLYKELPHEEGRLIVGNKWLNILFKSSEFSFSYYYIPANHRIYCPEMSSFDVKLRKENLFLGLQLLKNPRWDFEATRYFSRVSMPGRIDIGVVWEKDFVAYPERPGKEILNKKEVNSYKTALKKGKWNYLYQFTDPYNKTYKVIEVNDKIVVMPFEKIQFFNYRNPDYFKYFRQK